MPSLPGGHYLLDYLFELGPTKGEHPLDGSELVAWERLLGIEWQPYESRLLLRMSRAYLAEMHNASKPDAPPPWAAFARPWKWIEQQKGERRLAAFLR